MIAWRIAKAKHGAGIDGTSGLHADGRWHSKGTRVCHAAANVALAMLEIRVHVNSLADLPVDYCLYRFAFSDTAPMLRIEEADLPAGWRKNVSATRAIGDNAYRTQRALILDVPSVIVPLDRNLIVLGNHPAIGTVDVADMGSISLDDRLFAADR